MIEKDLAYIRNYFSDIDFQEENHTYTWRNRPIKESVSSVIKNFCEPFQAETVALQMCSQNKQLATKLVGQWKDTAAQACHKGTDIHLFAEQYFYNKNIKPKTVYEAAIIKFYNWLPQHILPVFSELKMVHQKFLFAGTADIVLYNTRNNTYVIADWKTNKDLDKNYKEKKLLSPFQDLLDSPYNKYQLQLSMYQLMLEQCNLKVSERVLLWLKDNGTIDVRPTRDLTLPLDQWLTEYY